MKKKLFKVITNVVLGIVIVIAAVVTVLSLNTREQGVASIAGYIPFSIQTESMEDTIMTGDLILTKTYTEEETLSENDIISFFAIEQNQTIIKTHRIIEVKDGDGMVSYVTKGDNNEIQDEVEVATGDIIAVYTGTRIAKMGNVLDFFRSNHGFLLCIILPLFIFFLYQLYSFINLVIEAKKATATAK